MKPHRVLMYIVALAAPIACGDVTTPVSAPASTGASFSRAVAPTAGSGPGPG